MFWECSLELMVYSFRLLQQWKLQTRIINPTEESKITCWQVQEPSTYIKLFLIRCFIKIACYLPLKVYFKIRYICVCVHVRYVYISVSTCGSPKGMSGPLELQLQMAGHHLTWVLRIKLQSTAGTPRILNYCTLSSLRKVMSLYIIS